MSDAHSPAPSPDGEFDLAIGVTDSAGEGAITARRAGGLVDLELCISPRQKNPRKALSNLAKALNLALKADFIETPLDEVYQAARVRQDAVHLIHRDFIGLGDGVFASVGKAVKAFQLTLRGPDAASPEGRVWIAEHGGGAFSGMLSLMGRKLNLLQEYEDKVPLYVEQTLDRLEARRMITDWHREDWSITTSTVGLDVTIRPAEPQPATT
jgi:hypothetical protein